MDALYDRLGRQVDVLIDMLHDGAMTSPDAGVRRHLLKVENVVAAVQAALGDTINDVRLDNFNFAACRFLDAVGAKVPVPGRQGRLSPVNRQSGEKRQLLESLRWAMDLAKVPEEWRTNGRVERRDIEAAWRAKDVVALTDQAWVVADCALGAVENYVLLETMSPAPVDQAAANLEQGAVARAVRFLIDHGLASEQNVAWVALAYRGVPWKLRKNFFKGIEDDWRDESDGYRKSAGVISKG